MAITYSFCLNLSSPSLPSRTIQSQTQAKAIAPRRGDEKWRKQCVAGMAATCMAFGGIFMQMGESDGSAIAKEMTMTTPIAEQKARWSEMRECPPWRLNSLETIVPENLPRPSAPRRWEAVGNTYLTKDAPPVKVAVKSSRNNCFSM